MAGQKVSAVREPVAGKEIPEPAVVVGEEKLLNHHSSLVAVAWEQTKMDRSPEGILAAAAETEVDVAEEEKVLRFHSPSAVAVE